MIRNIHFDASRLSAFNLEYGFIMLFELPFGATRTTQHERKRQTAIPDTMILMNWCNGKVEIFTGFVGSFRIANGYLLILVNKVSNIPGSARYNITSYETKILAKGTVKHAISVRLWFSLNQVNCNPSCLLFPKVAVVPEPAYILISP